MMNARIINKSTGLLSPLIGKVSSISGNVLDKSQSIAIGFCKADCEKFGTLKTSTPGDILVLTTKDFKLVQIIIDYVFDYGEEFAIIGQSDYSILVKMMGGNNNENKN